MRCLNYNFQQFTLRDKATGAKLFMRIPTDYDVFTPPFSQNRPIQRTL